MVTGRPYVSLYARAMKKNRRSRHLPSPGASGVLLRCEFDTEVHAAELGAFPLEATALHFVRQSFGRHPAFARLFGELLVALEEHSGLHLGELAGRIAVVIDEAAEGVALLAVFADGLDDGGRWFEALALPLEAAVDGPPEDARQLLAQFLDQGLILFVGRDGDDERNQAQAAPDAFVGPVDDRLVVAADDEFVRGQEVEKFLM